MSGADFGPIDWDSPILAAFRQGWLLRDFAVGYDLSVHVGRLVYLATPYSKRVMGWDGKWDRCRSERCVAQASSFVAAFAEAGVTAISPIVLAADAVHYTHGTGLDPLDGAFWERWCRPILQVCDAVVVPPIFGWRDSVGIWIEVNQALACAKPVFLANDEGWDAR